MEGSYELDWFNINPKGNAEVVHYFRFVKSVYFTKRRLKQ